MIKFNYKNYTTGFITEEEIESYKPRLVEIKNKIFQKGEMLDWLDKETTISNQELSTVKSLAEEIKSSADLFIVIGVGGSYLGAKAVIDALGTHFETKKPEIIFAGFDLSTDYIYQLINHMDNFKEIYINVISKSGSTMETNIAFHFLLEKLKQKYPNDYKKRVIITTDKEKGILRELCKQEGYRSLTVPENIGGRYSVMSSVGLLPIAVKGYDIDKILDGIDEGKKYYEMAEKIAVVRDIFFHKNYYLEAITAYDKRYAGLALWYQQLYAESQGKSKKGVLPFVSLNTTNLHSIGQYLQDGKNFVFETVLKIPAKHDLFLPDQQVYMKSVENVVVEKVAEAHLLGKTPSVIFEFEKIDEKVLGTFIYINFLACAIGGYLLGINPFDQPGVEEYKRLINQGIEELKKNKG